MARGPRGEKHAADVIGNAVKVMRIATGAETEELHEPMVGILGSASRSFCSIMSSASLSASTV